MLRKYAVLFFVFTLITTVFFCFSDQVYAQNSQDEEKLQPKVSEENNKENVEVSKSETPLLEDTVILATRKSANIFDVPYNAQVVNEKEIRLKKVIRTTPEIFSEEPSITVQKTGNAQGSPFLRGFTGFRTLFLVDGIRLNNSAFRDGPNQYWNTVDPFTISTLEIVKGPSSVLYGSDAIGGTVNAITRSRGVFGKGFNWDRRLTYRFGSADRSNVGRFELGGDFGKSVAFLGGGAFKDFNSVRGGRNVGLQPKTGYDEINADFKMEYLLNLDNKITLAYQRVDQNDAWRSHKTIYGISWEGTTVGDEKVRSLDQNRDLVYFQYYGKNFGKIFDSVQVSLSYQLQQEETYRVRSDDRSDIQGFKVGTVGFWTHANSSTLIGNLTYGLEYYHDNVDSYATKYNADGTLNSIEIQGPIADEATYDLLGIFLQDEVRILKGLDLIFGVRYTYAGVDADKVEDPAPGTQISLSDNWNNVVGSGRLLYHIGNSWNIYSGVSQGFRSPNLSDLTRFDSGRTDEIETPSPGLSPEKYIAYEAGIKTAYKNLKGQFSYYYTNIDDMIVRYPTGVVIDGDFEVQKANIGDGHIQGIEFQADYNFVKEWNIFGGLAWQRGEVDTYPTSAQILERKPMSRIPPLTGLVGLKWQHYLGKCWAEATVKIAGKQTRLSPGDEADTQRIPPGGTPGYVVLNLRGGVKITDALILSAVVENVTDEDYRIHGSGQNEPGTNFVVSADWKF